MAGLSEKQRRALREKAAKEAAERAAREAASDGRKRGPTTGIQGPPPGLVAVLILLAMIGGAIALGFWLSSADSPFGTPELPEDFGTSEDKGGYISDEGLPDKFGVHDVVENPAGILDEEDGPQDGQASGGDGDRMDADGGEAGTEQDGQDGQDGLVRLHVAAYMMDGMSPEEYAMSQGWPVGNPLEDGSMEYVVTAEQQTAAVEQATAELDALMADVASSGVIDSVAYMDEESHMTFKAYALGGHESDGAGWESALRPVLVKAAERAVLSGVNNPALSATVFEGSPEGNAVGNVCLVSGDAVASVMDGG